MLYNSVKISVKSIIYFITWLVVYCIIKNMKNLLFDIFYISDT